MITIKKMPIRINKLRLNFNIVNVANQPRGFLRRLN